MADPLFDEPARRQRQSRALTRSSVPFLAQRIADEWLERLAPVRRRFVRALVTGTPPSLQGRLGRLAEEVRFAPSIDAVAEEAEGSLDLILVMGELDSRDELPLLLRIIASRLAPGGLLAGAMPGGHSLGALRSAMHAADGATGSFSPRSHPRIEPGALASLLAAAGLADAVVDVDRVTLRYRSLARLVDDLRDHGTTNVLLSRPRTGLSRAAIAAASRKFGELATNGATEERIDLLHYAAWARHIGKDA
jgi:SAM-dependent methyltransferase